MNIMTLSLIVGGVGLFILFAIAGVFTYLETTPYKLKKPKHWEGFYNGK